MGPLLADLFERQFAPAFCAGRSDAWRTMYRVAIRWLGEALSRDPRTADLTKYNLDLVAAVLASAGYSRPRIQKLRRALAALWRFADRLGFAAPYEETIIASSAILKLPGAVASEPLKHWRHGQRIILPAPEPGAWRHYFETIYRPQRLPTAQKTTLASYQSLFVSWWRWRNRDLRIDETSDELAANYFAWLLELGRDPRSVNRQRAQWFALWRDAAERNLITTRPTIRKLPVDRNPPDSWSIEELAAIVAAAGQLPGTTRRHSLPHALLMRAVLLVGFHTAVRRRSLFAIRCQDVDLATGWVTVSGRNVKTRRGRRYRLPRYAVDAVQAIWSEDRDLLFPIGARHAINLFQKVERIAGLPRSVHRLGYFHKLRRSAATQAAILGGMHEASELLDHSAQYVTQLYVDPTRLPGNETSSKLPQLAAGGDRLSEARELLFRGKAQLAAIAARIILERAVARRCDRLREKLPPGVIAKVKLLGRRGLISRADSRVLSKVAAVANGAAHGRDPNAADVAHLIQVVAQFVDDSPEGPQFGKGAINA